MRTEDVFLEQLRKLGVADPRNPTAEELRLILGGYLENKRLDREAMEGYIEGLAVPLNTLLNGLKLLATSSGRLTAQVLTLIDRAIGTLEKELERCSSARERRQLRHEVFALIEQARGEVERERSHQRGLLATGAAVLGVIGGGALFVLTKGKAGPQLRKALLRVKNSVRKVPPT